MKTYAQIIRYDGKYLLVIPSEPLEREIVNKHVRQCEIILWDGRRISPMQRKKAYAIINDISQWSGHDPEYLKQFLKFNYCSIDGIDDFSLADTDMTTAGGFITYLIEFCFYNNIPSQDSMLDRTSDIDEYLYICLEYRKCAVCNKRAEVHHVDRVGMGRNRKKIFHPGMNAIALCNEHHRMAHSGEEEFFQKYHIHGIKLDEYLCRRLMLNSGNESEKEIFKIP